MMMQFALRAMWFQMPSHARTAHATCDPGRSATKRAGSLVGRPPAQNLHVKSSQCKMKYIKSFNTWSLLPPTPLERASADLIASIICITFRPVKADMPRT